MKDKWYQDMECVDKPTLHEAHPMSCLYIWCNEVCKSTGTVVSNNNKPLTISLITVEKNPILKVLKIQKFSMELTMIYVVTDVYYL